MNESNREQLKQQFKEIMHKHFILQLPVKNEKTYRFDPAVKSEYSDKIIAMLSEIEKSETDVLLFMECLQTKLMQNWTIENNFSIT